MQKVAELLLVLGPVIPKCMFDLEHVKGCKLLLDTVVALMCSVLSGRLNLQSCGSGLR